MRISSTGRISTSEGEFNTRWNDWKGLYSMSTDARLELIVAFGLMIAGNKRLSGILRVTWPGNSFDMLNLTQRTSACSFLSRSKTMARLPRLIYLQETGSFQAVFYSWTPCIEIQFIGLTLGNDSDMFYATAAFSPSTPDRFVVSVYVLASVSFK